MVIFPIKSHNICILCIAFVFTILFIPISKANLPTSHEYNQETNEENMGLRSSGALTNKQIIQDIFAELDNFYSNNAYYPEIYDGSIRADYYAVYIAYSLGKLAEIDVGNITAHLMSYYNLATNIFIDDYAKRYLDTDFDLMYFPCSTLLETNCYAVLALNIMGQIDSINVPEMIDFIWDCYDPINGGFIGQPYSESLSSKFKTPTADNTFFGVITLDILMEGDWSFYSDERGDIINFILGLQHPSSPIGFFNDNDYTLDSIQVYEPNIISSYYCIRVLDTFNSIASMNLNLFHTFLSIIYHTDTHAFDVGVSSAYSTECNVIASAMGLELSILTNYAGCDQDGTFSFVMTNLNSYSLWDASTTVKYHELIDTFQVIRSLSKAGRLEGVTLDTLDPLVSFMNDLFWNGFEYSLIAEDFTSQESLNAIISAYHFYDNILALDVNELYKDIKDSLKILGAGTSQFSSSLYNTYPDDNLFRSFPIEYYCLGNFVQIPRLERMYTHKSMFYALDSLNKLYKLSLFAPLIDEDQIISEIVASQFLDPSQENNGAFLDSSAPLTSDPSIRNKFAFFEYSYYAIKSLELLCQISSSYSSILDLNIDTSSFYEFISENLVQDAQILYFEFPYSVDALLNLKNTYFACYVLNAIDMYELDDQKIRNYVNQVVDYSNIESIYYAYKLLTLIGQPVELDATVIRQLVQDLYHSNFHQFSYSTNSEERNWLPFAWICELATKSETQIAAQYLNNVYLGGNNAIIASFSNLIVSNPSQPDEMKFESAQLGVVDMTLQPDETYWVEVSIPIDAANFPTVQGAIKAYEAGTVEYQTSVEFTTTYGINQIATTFDQNLNIIDISSELSFLTGIGEIPLTDDANVQLNVVIDGELQPDAVFLTKTNFATYSRFTTQYQAPVWGSYFLYLFLDDGIASGLTQIGEFSFDLSMDIDVIVSPKQPIRLGDNMDLQVEFFDNSLQSRVQYDEVVFSSPELGDYTLDLQLDGRYLKSIGVTIDESFYPQVTGTIKAYNDSVLLKTKSVTIDTYYDLAFSKTQIPSSQNVNFQVNCWFITDGGQVNMFADSTVIAKIFKDGTQTNEFTFLPVTHHQDYTEFSIIYDKATYGNHTLEVYVDTKVSQTPDYLFSNQITYEKDIVTSLQYSDSCKLGATNHILINYYDMSTTRFVTYDEVMFQSVQTGSAILTLQGEHDYGLDLVVPIANNCYPKIEGQITATLDEVVELTENFDFNTTYKIVNAIESSVLNGAVVIICQAWLENTPENNPMISTTQVEAIITHNESILADPLLFSVEAQINFTEYTATYAFEEYGTYELQVRLYDPFIKAWSSIGDPITVDYKENQDPQIIVYDDPEEDDGAPSDNEDSEDSDNIEDPPEGTDNSTEEQPTDPDTDPGLRTTSNPQFLEGLPLLAVLIGVPTGGLLIPLVNGGRKRNKLSVKSLLRKHK